MIKKKKINANLSCRFYVDPETLVDNAENKKFTLADCGPAVRRNRTQFP